MVVKYSMGYGAFQLTEFNETLNAIEQPIRESDGGGLSFVVGERKTVQIAC